MFIGEWNKSVILTYLGMASAILGMYLAFNGDVLQAFACLMVSGVCDLFDGAVARKCKRNEAQKQFGIQLDSLVDVINFVALPMAIGFAVGLNRWYHVVILVVFGICGIARLAFFNVSSELRAKSKSEGKDTVGDAPISHYRGLPVTYTALILPLVYLLHLLLEGEVFLGVYAVAMVFIALLNILDIKIAKPRGLAYLFFAVLALVMLFVYLVVLG